MIAYTLILTVMPGLVPGIHVLAVANKKDVDGRDDAPALTEGDISVCPVGLSVSETPCYQPLL